jgi:hypothetical protein
MASAGPSGKTTLQTALQVVNGSGIAREQKSVWKPTSRLNVVVHPGVAPNPRNQSTVILQDALAWFVTLTTVAVRRGSVVRNLI